MSNRVPSALRRIVFFLLLVLTVVWVASPIAASAHAQLVRSVPASGALLDKAPTEIQLFLSESVSLDFSTVKLFDRARNEIGTGTLGHVHYLVQS